MKVYLRVVSERVEKYIMPLRYSLNVHSVSNKQQRTQRRTLQNRADDADDGRRTAAEHNTASSIGLMASIGGANKG